MIIEFNRFLTTEEVRVQYSVPDDLAPKLLPALPVFSIRPDGTRIHLESEVDEKFAELARHQRLDEARCQPMTEGRPGRKNETEEIALYADDLHRQEMTWKEVFKACKQRWPNDDRVTNVDQLRATWRRHFRRDR